MFLLDDILLLPVKGVVWLAEKIKDHAEKDLYNVDALKESLQELQRRYEEKEISQKEYDEEEKKFLNAIDVAQKFHKARRDAGLEK